MKEKRSSIQEYGLYIVFGVLTTAVNYVVYFIVKNVFLIHYSISNVLAFAVAVIFAYVTNKKYVFQSDRIEIAKEFMSFLSFRLLSMAIETALLVLSVEFLDLNDDISKIAVSIITVVLNYIFGKFVTFRNKEDF